MNRKRLLKHLLFLMFFIFIVDFLAKIFFWYSLIWYLDIIMHFLGGFWVGLFFFYIFSLKNINFRPIDLFFKIFLSTLAVGILFEFYEFFLNIISVTNFDLFDTLSDVFFDILGALFSMFYFFKIIMTSSSNEVE